MCAIEVKILAAQEKNVDKDLNGINNLRTDIEKAVDYSMVEFDLTYEEVIKVIGTLEMMKQRLCIDYQIHLDKFNSSKKEEEE